MASKKTTTKQPADIDDATALAAAVPDAAAPDGGSTKRRTKRAKQPRPAKTKDAPARPAKLSAVDAAAKVLQESGQPMNCQALIQDMAAKGYWSSPAGKTPASTLYAAIARETKIKGSQARFQKTSRGQFVYHSPQAS